MANKNYLPYFKFKSTSEKKLYFWLNLLTERVSPSVLAFLPLRQSLLQGTLPVLSSDLPLRQSHSQSLPTGRQGLCRLFA